LARASLADSVGMEDSLNEAYVLKYG